jgi:hypothetical protein
MLSGTPDIVVCTRWYIYGKKVFSSLVYVQNFYNKSVLNNEKVTHIQYIEVKIKQSTYVLKYKSSFSTTHKSYSQEETTTNNLVCIPIWIFLATYIYICIYTYIYIQYMLNFLSK